MIITGSENEKWEFPRVKINWCKVKLCNWGISNVLKTSRNISLIQMLGLKWQGGGLAGWEGGGRQNEHWGGNVPASLGGKGLPGHTARYLPCGAQGWTTGVLGAPRARRGQGSRSQAATSFWLVFHVWQVTEKGREHWWKVPETRETAVDEVNKQPKSFYTWWVMPSTEVFISQPTGNCERLLTRRRTGRVFCLRNWTILAAREVAQEWRVTSGEKVKTILRSWIRTQIITEAVNLKRMTGERALKQICPNFHLVGHFPSWQCLSTVQRKIKQGFL